MGTFWPLITGILLTVSAFAQTESAQFVFRGQADEHVALERILTETRTRTEMRDTTCTRQIPYQAEECGNETRYRQECRWVPAREECGTNYEQRCENVTRYRQECHQGPSRRECRRVPGEEVCATQPGRQVCRDVPGEQRCRTEPGEQVCSQPTPPREQCRTLPNGQQECRTIPGRDSVCTTRPGRQVCEQGPSRRECHQEPGERVCTRRPDREECYNVPGEDICRSVPYQDQECRSVPVPYCRTIPGQNVCEQIPYQEHVCRNVTRYRPEQYPCKEPVQVPYEVKISVQGQLDVKFLNPEFATEVPFTANVGANRALELKAQAPKDVLVGTRPGAPAVVTEGETVTIKQSIAVRLTTVKELQGLLTQSLAGVVIDFPAKKLSFTAKGAVELDDAIEIVLEGKKKQLFSTKKGTASIKGTLRELKATLVAADAGQVAVQIDLSKVDLSKITDKKTFKMMMKHVKGLPDGFGWAGQVPELKSEKEAVAKAIK